MNCRRAQAMMHDALDHKAGPERALDEHLRACVACRGQWARLKQVTRMVAETQVCAEEEAAERVRGAAATARRLKPAATTTGALQRRLPHLAWACVALAAFALGHCLQTPQVVERTVRVPVVKERLIRTEVPVYRERIVERVVTRTVRVPVVRTRVVYRDRLARSTGVSPVGGGPAVSPVARREVATEAEPTDMLTLTYPAPETLPTASYSETMYLAKVVAGEPGE